jgi:hypothetical protein
MAATNPMKVKDLLHKYGWDFIPRLAAMGLQFQSEAQVLFVDSGATNALDADDGVHGHSFENPLATIDYAIGLCTADQGDVILVAAGHAETISGAAGIDLDVDDVTVVGLGVNDKRPKITYSAEASTFEINADNVTVRNLQFVSSKTGGTTVAIDIKTGSDYVTIEDCKFYETANTLELLTAITAEDKTDYITIRNCEFLNLAGGDNVAALLTEADEHDFLVVDGCTFIGDWTNACLDLNAAAIVYPLIRNCTMVNLDATAGKVILLDASTVATMVDLRVATGKGYGYPVSDVTASFEINCHACEAGAITYAGMGSKTATDLSA